MFRLTFKNKKGEIQEISLATERIVAKYLANNSNVVEVIIIIQG